MADDQIDIFSELEVADGKADELRAIAKLMVAHNQQEEPGILV